MVCSHLASFRTTQLLKHTPDGHILYQRRVKGRVRREGSTEDMEEEFFGIRIFETALFGASKRRTEGGQDDNVQGVFGKDGPESAAEVARYGDFSLLENMIFALKYHSEHDLGRTGL